MLQIAEGDFVIVAYNVPGISAKKKGTTVRKYLGKILDVRPTTCEVKYLRPYKGRKEVFSFPDKDDIDTVRKESIIRTLHKTVEFRGKFDFLMDVFKKSLT